MQSKLTSVKRCKGKRREKKRKRILQKGYDPSVGERVTIDWYLLFKYETRSAQEEEEEEEEEAEAKKRKSEREDENSLRDSINLHVLYCEMCYSHPEGESTGEEEKREREGEKEKEKCYREFVAFFFSSLFPTECNLVSETILRKCFTVATGDTACTLVYFKSHRAGDVMLTCLSHEAERERKGIFCRFNSSTSVLT